jgi:hypothetical protein
LPQRQSAGAVETESWRATVRDVAQNPLSSFGCFLGRTHLAEGDSVRPDRT